jgi:hypothetical protein
MVSRNRAAARTIVTAVQDGLLPDLGAARDIMEALGLVAPGGTEILPDPHDLMVGPGEVEFRPLPRADISGPDLREPPVDRRFVPEGLRNYSARKPPTERPRCGSPNGYRDHLAAGENACLPCADAWRDKRAEERAAKPKTGKPGQPRKEIEHGTERGHAMHRRRGIPLCDDCRAAEKEARRIRKERKVAAGELPAPPRRIEERESPIEHGTNAGYMKERRRKLPICDPCRRAATLHRAKNKAASQERKNTQAQEERAA